MNMPPIKFEIKPGLWIGVGDRVWTCYRDDPRTGIVTGFGGNEDEWLLVEVTHTNETLDGNSRQSRAEYSFDQVFASEKDAWTNNIKALVEEQNEMHRKSIELDKQIRKLSEKWL
jgi:hypothetical protein